MGLRHKTIIDLEKSNTSFIYEVNSNQSWQYHQIVWCSTEAGPFNRVNLVSRQTPKEGEEYELTDYMGYMMATGDVTCEFKWQEEYFNNPEDEMANRVEKSLPNLLHGPLNTKYPATPFYWRPSDGVNIIYNNTITILGKPQHLDSIVFKDDTWQKGPGLVEYIDDIGRGGKIKTIGNNVKFRKNWHMTLIWQPDG